MDASFEKTVFERLSKLPQATQDAIRDTNLSLKFQEIARANSLHIDQAAELEEETLMLILGFSTAEEFLTQITQALHITKEQATKIQTDINEKIFLPIRGHMQAASTPATTSPALHPADEMLTQKTISVAPPPPTSTTAQTPPTQPPATAAATPNNAGTSTTPPKPDPAAPQPYKADPYREPIQ